MNRMRLFLEKIVAAKERTGRTISVGVNELARVRSGWSAASVRRSLAVFTFALAVMLLQTSSGYAETKTSAGTGNWNTAGTWSPSGVPASGDDVVIANGHTVTVNGSVSCATLTINTGTNPSGITISSTNSLTVTGAVTINAPADNSSDRTFAVGAGTFTCASITMADVGAGVNGDIILSISTGTATVSGNVTMSGSSTENFINLTSTGTLNLGGTITGGSLSPGASSTVNYNQAAAQDIRNVTYNSLTLSGSGTKTLSGNTTVNGTLSLQGTATFALGGNTLTYGTNAILEYQGSAAQTASTSEFPASMTADVIIDNASGVTIAATLRTLNGNLTLTSGTFAVGTLLEMGSTGTPLITRSGGDMTGTLQGANDYDVTYTVNSKTTGGELSGSALNNATVSLTAGQTLTLGAAFTADGTITIGAGSTLDVSASDFAISVGNDWTNNGTFTPRGGTVTFDGTTTQTTNASQTFNNVVMNKSGTLDPGSPLTVNDLTLTLGTFEAPAALNVKGNWTRNGGVYNAGTLVTFTGTTTQTVSGTPATTFTSITINSGATVQLSAGVAWTVNTTLTVNGTIVLPDTVTITGNSATLTVGASGLIQTADADGVTGSATTTSFDTGFTTTSLNTNGTVEYNRSGNQTITGRTYLNLTSSGSGIKTLGGATTVAGVLTLNVDITTGANILTQSGGSAGTGDVVGNVTRTDLNSGGAKAFGNPNVTITKTAGTVVSMTVNLVKGSTPNNFTNSVERIYSITPSGASTTPSFTAAVQLHYLDGELNGLTEDNNLQLWREDVPTWIAQGADAGAAGHNFTDKWVKLSGVTLFSRWTIAGTDTPTAVDMINLKATRYDGRVLLEWQTGYEINNVGFNIYRDQKGTLTKVTPEPIAGSALIAGPRIEMRAGFAYSWWDNDAENDDDARYWLEDIDLTGRTAIHGPFGALQAPAGDRVPPRGKGRSSLLSALGHEASEQGASAPVETMAKVAKLTPARFEVQAAITSLPAVKMSVQREGWYRVEQPELVAAGIPANVDPRRLQLFVDGQEVPMMVTGGKPAKFDAADGVEFYGVGIDSPSTDTHVYWLVAGSQQGQRITNAGGNSTSTAPEAFPYTVERRDKVVYFAGLKNGGGEKFFGPVMFNAQAVDQSLVVRNVAATGSATMEVSVQGLTQSPHNVKVTLNGEELGTIQFSGTAKGVGQYSIASSSLKEGTNQVQLVGPAGFGDMSMVEYVRLTYQHTNMADGNALKFPVTGRHKATIGGFTSSNVRVVDITKPAAPQELDATVIQESTGLYSVSATAPGKGAKTLMAFAADQQKKPTSMTLNQPSNWRKPGREADYLAVTRKELVSSLEPLKTQRQSQGLVVAIADIEDVYDEFSFGQKTPQALKDFFAYAKSSWAKKPRFALLAGDATYDPKNYTGTGDNDVVPTKLVETSFNETATDDWFVDFDNDGVPDMAIGRLPVRTVEEATAMVSKIVGYDKSFGTGRVLMVTDQNQGYNFEAADTQLRGLMPASVAVTGIRRGEVGDANARSQLLDGINQGQKLVNFYGHGSTRVWTNAPILSAADAASFVNTDKLALFDAMTCLNGFFHDVTIDSLGEALLKSKGAAIAVWASTGMTDPSAQVLMNEEAIRLLFSGAGLTIGEVTARAKAAAGNPDVRRTWVLLGDPATKIK